MKKTLFISSLLAILFPALLAEEAQTPTITFTYTNYDEATGLYDSEVTYNGTSTYTAGAVGMITESITATDKTDIITVINNSGNGQTIDVAERPLRINNSVINITNAATSTYVISADANGDGAVYGTRTINVSGEDTKIWGICGGVLVLGDNNRPSSGTFFSSNPDGKPVMSKEKGHCVRKVA